MTGQRWIGLGAIFCGLAVATGAFAAHGLDKIFVAKYADMTRTVGGQTIPLATKFLNDFKTGAEYQMYHGLALIAVGLIAERRPSSRVAIAAWAFTIGILLFSGSLYVLTLTGVTKWGAVTPFGGIAFLIGWGFVAATIFESNQTQTDDSAQSSSSRDNPVGATISSHFYRKNRLNAD
jgi:uncharacterized membrane protein YgdD (TMEM256/DUF423 family)